MLNNRVPSAPTLLLTLLLLSAPLASAAANVSDNLKIEPCPMPLLVRLQGLPPQGAVQFAETISTCGRREMAELDYTETLPELTSRERARLPQLELTLRDGKLDVHLQLHEGKTLLNCYAKQLAPGATGVPLRCNVANDKGILMKLSVEALPGHYVSINALAVTPQQLLSELTRVEHIQFHHTKRLGTSQSGFVFDMISIEQLLRLIADTAGMEVRRDGDAAWVFGTVKHAEAIKRLWLEADKYRENYKGVRLSATLQKIVDLSKPADANDLAAYTVDAIAELVELKLEANDYVRAEALVGLRLAQIEGMRGPQSADYALGLLSLARVQLRQFGTKSGLPTAAQPALVRALVLLQQFPPESGLPEDVRALAYVGKVFLDIGEYKSFLDLGDVGYIDNAQTLSDYAHAIMSTEFDQTSIDQSIQASLNAKNMYTRLGLVLEARGDDPEAAIQLERALALGESIGIDTIGTDSSTMFLREMLIAIARRAGQSERVARYTATQAAFIKAKDGSTQYAGAMAMLSVAQARKGDYLAAISSWDYVVKFRRELCGKTSTEYVAALRACKLKLKPN